MVKRKIVEIDEEKCNGCGICVPACHEGAIVIEDGKARLVDDKFCDGLGDCLAECPQGAINIIEREAAEYNEEAVEKRMATNKKPGNNVGSNPRHSGGCPGSIMMDFRLEDEKNVGRGQDNKGITTNNDDVEIKIKSQLQQWPVQLMLVPEKAPYFDETELLLTADCVPFAYPDYHLDLLKGKSVAMGCPKLDDNRYYVKKLTSIIKKNNLTGITVAFMEVPCCSGMVKAAEIALAQSGKDIPLKKIRISIKGEIL